MSKRSCDHEGLRQARKRLAEIEAILESLEDCFQAAGSAFKAKVDDIRADTKAVKAILDDAGVALEEEWSKVESGLRAFVASVAAQVQVAKGALSALADGRSKDLTDFLSFSRSDAIDQARSDITSVRLTRSSNEPSVPMAGEQYDLIDRLVGRNICNHRQQRGMSQSELAAKIGVTFQQMREFENGTDRVGSSRLFRIASVLEVPINFFFESLRGLQIERAEYPLVAHLADPHALRMLRAFCELQIEMRKSITNIVTALATLAALAAQRPTNRAD